MSRLPCCAVSYNAPGPFVQIRGNKRRVVEGCDLHPRVPEALRVGSRTDHQSAERRARKTSGPIGPSEPRCACTQQIGEAHSACILSMMPMRCRIMESFLSSSRHLQPRNLQEQPENPENSETRTSLRALQASLLPCTGACPGLLPLPSPLVLGQQLLLLIVVDVFVLRRRFPEHERLREQ